MDCINALLHGREVTVHDSNCYGFDRMEWADDDGRTMILKNDDFVI